VFDPRVVILDALLPTWKMSRERSLLLLVRFDGLGNERLIGLFAGFQAINLPAQAGLSPVDTPGIQKQRAADLLEWLIARIRLFEDGNGNERANSPIKP
jgi:hypothetical protein